VPSRSLSVTRLIRLLPGLLLATFLIYPATARADQYEAVLTRAIAVKEKARAQNDPSGWLEASRLFREADRLRPTPETKYELGYAAEQLREHDLAVELYEICLEQGIGGRAREHARDFVARNAPSMVRLSLHGEPGTVVAIGGLERTTLPAARPITAFAGLITLEVRDPKGTLRTRTVDGRAGQAVSVDVSAPEPPVPTPPPPAAERPRAQPQERRAPTPTRATPPTPSSVPGVTARRPRDGPSSSSALEMALVIGGSALAAASGTTLLVAYDRIDRTRKSLHGKCLVLRPEDQCDEALTLDLQRAAQDDVNTIATWKALRTTSLVGLGAGLGVVGLGVLIWATDTRSEAPRASLGTRATVGAGREGWSVTVESDF
jgi:hypothetical protein